MITRLTGRLIRVLDDEARVEVGSFEYQVLLPESVRRQLQLRTSQELTLHISEYYEANQSMNRFTPRKLGFLSEQELEFFDLFCTVDKIGPKKALKAMARPVREIADAISRGDSAWLTSLPGIGSTTAEQIIMTLKKKMAPFLVTRTESVEQIQVCIAENEPPKKTGKKKPAPEPVEMAPLPSGDVVDDAYAALIAMGMTPIEARAKIDLLLNNRQSFKTVDEAIALMFRSKR
jgi:holliday junction DNA helicase RuvA